LKFDLVVAIFPNLITNDYKSHVVVNGLVTFWLISTSESLPRNRSLIRKNIGLAKIYKLNQEEI
jgi:hypothetical protein